MGGTRSDFFAIRKLPSVTPNKSVLSRAAVRADLAQEDDRISFDWTSIIRWRVHSIQVFIVEALCWVGRPLSATELKALCDGTADLDAISFHLQQLAKLQIVEKVAKLKVRKSQGLKEETFFVLTDDPNWANRLHDADPRDILAAAILQAAP
jgi:hypothetical protein